jgi:hypothetical protein
MEEGFVLDASKAMGTWLRGRTGNIHYRRAAVTEENDAGEDVSLLRLRIS